MWGKSVCGVLMDRASTEKYKEGIVGGVRGVYGTGIEAQAAQLSPGEPATGSAGEQQNGQHADGGSAQRPG